METPPPAWPATTDDLDHWAAAVARHPLWARVPDLAAREAARLRTVELAVHLSWLRREGLFSLADDAWQDLGFATRLLDRVGRLTDALPAATPLQAGEVALLLATPLIFDTHWATVAAAARPVAPHDLTPSPDATSDRAAFERFAASYAQPHRRAMAAVARGQHDAAEEIGWWLLHRFIVRDAAAYTPAAIAPLLGPGGGAGAGSAGAGGAPADPTFAPTRVAALLRALRSDPGFLARTDTLVPVAPDGVRERLVGYLLVAARALAVEAVALPEVIGDHLGIVDPVRPAQLHATLRAARWEPRGGSPATASALVLAAACTHPAIEVALRTHVEAVNAILTEVQRAAVSDETLAGLRWVPTHVTTDGLGPAQVDGERAYQSAGVRFRLAEDRVQELLMGEQLYGDPALAIRELYQNALDACRYREARGEFLRRARGLDEPWQGEIRFTQGIDENGRPFLDCADNGIGMGVRELSEVFAQAGVRLADLPEFLEEQAEWAQLDPPVHLFPNSRFGIGVLSYFMLADEITVDTCRMGRDGRPGPRLRVAIAGPGSLFRIRALGPGEATGTTVRLHLRTSAQAVSCVETLRSVLWVADFATTAVTPGDRQEWRPGELSESTPPMQSVDKRTGTGVVADPRSGVWWCAGDGAILADGLWAGQELLGAVVNLRRDLAPRLSVDRTKILAYREEDLERLLWEAVDPLVAAGSTVLTYDWLYGLARSRPLIADVIFDRALAGGYHQWSLGGETIDARIAGCFLTDGGGAGGPDQVVEWRLTALALAGRQHKLLPPGTDWGPVLRARPTDALIISFDVDGSAPWLDPVEIVPLAHLVRVARRLGRHPSEIAARLEELGYTTAVGHETVGADPDDLLLLSRDLDSSRPWLHTDHPVPLPHVVKAAQRTGRPLGEVIGRLTTLGFTLLTDPADLAVASFEPADLTLCSRDLDGTHPWLDPREPVKLLHVVRLAHKLERDIADIAARLDVLGYPLPAGIEGLHSEEDDLVLLSRDLDGASPWLDPAEPVPPVHLLRCARRTSRKPSEVAARLAAFGLPAAPDPAFDDIELAPDDQVITSRDLEGVPPWLDPTRPVTVLHLLRAAEVRGTALTEIADRLRLLGYQLAVPPEEIIVDRLDTDDTIIASVDLDGTHPWLDSGQPVPAMHLLRAARATDRDLHDITARLTVLGYAVQTTIGGLTVEQLTRDDLVMTSQDLDGSDPWLRAGERVGLPHILQAAKRLRRPVPEVAARLRLLGYAVDTDLDSLAIDKLRTNDLTYASTDLDGTRPWLDRDAPVPLAHLYAAAAKTRQPLTEVAARLRALGYVTPDLDVRLPRALPGGV